MEVVCSLMSQHFKWFFEEKKKSSCCVLQTIGDKDNPSCYLHQAQKPASDKVCRCVSACSISKCTVNGEIHEQILEQLMLLSRHDMLSGHFHIFEEDDAK